MLLKYKDHKENNVADKVKEKIKEELNSVRDVLERYNLHFELDFNVIEPPELKERPPPPIRTIEVYKRVSNEDELKDVVKDDRFLETPYKKGFHGKSSNQLYIIIMSLKSLRRGRFSQYTAI